MQRTKKLIASVTLVAFTAAACTQQAATIDETSEITVETWRAGDYEPELVGTETIDVEAISFARKVIIGGSTSVSNIASIPDGTFVLPLNNGESATIKRTGSRFEIVSFTGPTHDAAGKARGTVTAVELRGDDTIALRYADSSSKEADILVKLSDVAAADREAVQAAFALKLLVMSLEDVEQGWVVVALIMLAASVTAWWLWMCYDHNKSCAERCERWGYSGYGSGCGSLAVDYKNGSMKLGFTGDYYCYCQ